MITTSDVDIAELRGRWAASNMVPLWESPTAHKPDAAARAPTLWKWSDVRAHALDAIRATEMNVERRVLSLVSPHRKGPEDEATVNNVAAAIQILRPGESARPHRHSMNALRLVLEGSGVTTFVDGKACPMHDRDLVLTPAWTWHSHVHEGDEPMLWLDVLDVPLHLKLDTASFEPGPMHDAPETFDDRAFATAGFLAPGSGRQDYSPMFTYPYSSALEALAAAPQRDDGSRVLDYVNPCTGKSPLSTLSVTLVQPGSSPMRAVRSTSSSICCVLDGAGVTRADDVEVAWEKNDIFALPHGNWISHTSRTEHGRLLVISDAPALAALGLLKTETR